MKTQLSTHIKSAGNFITLLCINLLLTANVSSASLTPPKSAGNGLNSSPEIKQITLTPPIPFPDIELSTGHATGTHLSIEIDGNGYHNGSPDVRYEPIDNDGDGYDETIDCDDNDKYVWQNGVFYYDGDGDGYDDGSGTTTLCYGDYPPPGYIDFTYGTDCDDTDGSVWQSGEFYYDGDGDGYDDGSGFNTICYGDSPPYEYISYSYGTDCNDSDGTVWQTGYFYYDGDGDGYDDGTGQYSFCYGFDIPAGYIEISKGTDCDDYDGSVWVTSSLYVDNDNDNHDNGMADVCWNGFDPPYGYNNFTSGHDVDDNDPMVWQMGQFYIDWDHDGYENGSGLNTVQYGDFPPDEFVDYSYGIDCNDDDPAIWQNGDFYYDGDGDGYDDGTGLHSICYGTDFPPNYSEITSGVDCNDAEYLIHGMPDPPLADGTTICSGEKADLFASGVGTISWYDAPTAGNLLIASANYQTPSLTVTTTFYAEDYTCVASSSRTGVTVTVNPLPAAVAGTDRSISSGNTTQLGAVAVSGNQYDWTSSPEGYTSDISNPIVNPTLTTTYTLIETVLATGCFNSNSVTVTILPTRLQFSVLLDGIFNPGTGAMNTTLNSGGLLPLTQPYHVVPWSYTGTEKVESVPDGVVDWILVELRQAPTPDAAIPGTKLPYWPKAFFLKSDGTIVDTDGSTLPALGSPDITPGNNLYVIVRHRNHVAIMSSDKMTITDNKYVYDFTADISKAYGGSAGYRQIVPGLCGMVGGDANSNGDISTLDFTQWSTDFGLVKIYLPSDINGDGQVSVLDFTKWAINFGLEASPPVKSLNIHGAGIKPESRYKSQVPGE